MVSFEQRSVLSVATFLIACLPFITPLDHSLFLSDQALLKRCTLICAREHMDTQCPCYMLNQQQPIKVKRLSMMKQSRPINDGYPDAAMPTWIGSLLRHNDDALLRHNGQIVHELQSPDFDELQLDAGQLGSSTRGKLLSGIFKRMMQYPNDRQNRYSPRTKKRWLDMTDGYAGPGTLVPDMWQGDSGRNKPFRYGR